MSTETPAPDVEPEPDAPDPTDESFVPEEMLEATPDSGHVISLNVAPGSEEDSHRGDADVDLFWDEGMASSEE